MFFQAMVRISIQVDRDKVKLIKVKERILTPIRTGVSLNNNNNFREQDLKVGVKVECSSKVKDKMCRIEMLEDSTGDKKQQ